MKIFATKIAPLFRKKLRLTLRFLEELERTQWLSREELEEIQQDKLLRLCRHFGIEEVKDLDDLKELPLKDKEDLRGFIPARAPPGRRPVPQRTTGSTGKALEFYSDSVELCYKTALAYRGWSWTGWRLGDKIVDFTVYEPMNWLKKTYWRLMGHMHLYAIESIEDYMGRYAGIIKSYRPRLIRGYPSFLSWLAEALEGQVDWKCAVVTHGENLSPYRERISRAFRVYDSYAIGECRSIAFECERHKLHVAMEGCVLEVVDGELVVTNLDNYVEPFIRYRTGDLGEIVWGKCRCGRDTPVISKILGRTYETYIAPSGELVHPTYFGVGMRRYFKYVKEWQAVIYPDENLIEVRIVPTSNYYEGAVDLKWVSERFHMDARLTLVEGIERGPRGKRVLVRVMR